MSHDVTARYDLRRKSGDLPPGEERGAIDITTQWFFNPAVAGLEVAKAKKKGDFGLTNWIGEVDSDTESVRLYVAARLWYIVGSLV